MKSKADVRLRLDDETRPELDSNLARRHRGAEETRDNRWKSSVGRCSTRRRVGPLADDETGQMLLATGLILMLSLLSMAWYGISVASLGEPYDTGTHDVLDATESFGLVWQPLIENRSADLVAGGADWQEAMDSAANSTAADLMRHGEHRGVEIILTDISVTNSSGTFTVSCEVGIADRHARLQLVGYEAEIILS
jgi:hypothetical protein